MCVGKNEIPIKHNLFIFFSFYAFIVVRKNGSVAQESLGNPALGNQLSGLLQQINADLFQPTTQPILSLKRCRSVTYSHLQEKKI